MCPVLPWLIVVPSTAVIGVLPSLRGARKKRCIESGYVCEPGFDVGDVSRQVLALPKIGWTGTSVGSDFYFLRGAGLPRSDSVVGATGFGGAVGAFPSDCAGVIATP